MPARPGIGEEVVEKPCAQGEYVGHKVQDGIVGDGIQLPAGQPGKEVHPNRADQRLGEGIVDQRLIAPGGGRPVRRDHRGGGAHTGGQVPAVVVCSCHVNSFDKPRPVDIKSKVTRSSARASMSSANQPRRW
jgi:hypothetical protein